MTDGEKDMHIAALEQEVRELKVQVSALYSLFLEEDPTDPQAGSKAKRIMDVVKLVERSNWAAKGLVYIFLTAGGVFGAWAAIRGGLGR
ncbi:hypothetical protein [Loktanella sp. 3ANDIMAR09]|uniref:hypothetical protein n=1 Tax=Loktanella sp. 3ANDIMAR09 TaxID=1225657 RepID=UPI000A9BE87A|nr:hypothetical protein [Loktanella sp. 3ANDIMAR09]